MSRPSTSPDGAGPVKTCSRLHAAGRTDEALRSLGEALRRREVPASDLDAAGRLLARVLPPEREPSARVRILGQCTTSWIAPALAATAWGRGACVSVEEGGFDNVLQELHSASWSADVVVLLPWSQRLLGDGRRADARRVEDEVAFWRAAQSRAADRGLRIVQVGYDAWGPGPLGYQVGGREDGAIALVRAVNARLRESLPPDAGFVDLEQASARIGKQSFYDRRGWLWTRQPFSAAGSAELCWHLWAAIRALTRGPKKVLVLDLDGTLWGGLVGELGPLGVRLADGPDGEAYRCFQQHVKGLAGRGVVLAVASKNDPEDARAPFLENPLSILRLDDFAAFEASWDPKPRALERIARTLGLGLDSFVFFDDSPAEREHVLQSLPEVEVVDVPPDAADYVAALEQGLWFETPALTAADLERREQYQAEAKRRGLEASAASIDDWLRSLEMVARTRPLAEADLPRAVQLLAKTNQFNLTSRRHGEAELRRAIAGRGALALVLELRDKFGDYGLISLVLGESVPHDGRAALRLDTWLMSCRAIGRGVEDHLLNRVVREAAEIGCEAIIGEYVRTAKNGQVAGLYERFGFRRLGTADGAERFVLDLESFQERTSFILEEEAAIA